MRVTAILDLLILAAAAAVEVSLVVDCDGRSVWPVDADAVEIGGVGVMVLDLAAEVGAGFVLGVATGAGLGLVIVGADLLLVAGVGVGLVLGFGAALGVGTVLIFGMVKAGGVVTVDSGGTSGCWPAIADLPLAAGASASLW